MKKNKQKLAGFTIIEMLVVVGVISAISGLFLVNFRALEGPRNLKIAQNMLTTDIRKIQSYTLSSRNVGSNNNPAKYYIVSLDTQNATKYILGAIDNADDYYELQNITLPRSVAISDLAVKLSTGEVVSAKCAQIAFSLPFGRVITDYKLSSSKSDCDIVSTFNNSSDLSQNKNIITTLTLQDLTSQQVSTKTIEINGVSQVIQGN